MTAEVVPATTEQVPPTKAEQREVRLNAKAIQRWMRHAGCRKGGSLIPVPDEQRYETKHIPLAVSNGKGGSEMVPPVVTDHLDRYKSKQTYKCSKCGTTIGIPDKPTA